VHRVQDGAQDRAELTLAEARRECADLNAQARILVGTMGPVYDDNGAMVQAPAPIYASMIHGEISQYEVRSTAGLVIA
jgi:hypothetical protein